MSMILNNFNDIEDKINVLCDKVVYYRDSNVVKKVFLKKPTTFDIGGSKVHCKGWLGFHKAGQIAYVFISKESRVEDYSWFRPSFSAGCEVQFDRNGKLKSVRTPLVRK